MEYSSTERVRPPLDPMQNPAVVAVLNRIAATVQYPPSSLQPLQSVPPTLPCIPQYPPSTAAAQKEAKELFVGNIVASGVSDFVLKDFLNAAMRQVGLVTGPEDAISGIRMNNKFCFIEFRNPEDCTKALNLNGIPFMGSVLKINRPAKYSGPAIPTRSWQELTGQSVPTEIAASTSSIQLDPQTKGYREIFVGNISPGAPESSIRELIGGALQKMGLSSLEGESPIASIRLNQKFCFAEFKTMEDAANALNLNGIPLNGIPLKLSRPAKFEVPSHITLYSWDDLMARWITGELKLLTAGTPSTVLCITNMVTSEDMSDESLISDMIEDTKEECAQFGSVRSVVVPRLLPDGTCRGLGRMFVDMASEDEAKSVLVALKGRTFDNRVVGVKFYPQLAYNNNEYGLTFPPIVVTTSGIVPLSSVLSR